MASVSTDANHPYRGHINQEEPTMKISARNVLQGVVKSVTHGAVNSEVVIELPGGAEIVSIITKTSAESLGLAVGKEVHAVIKASNVMIAAE
jgi:molybdopterin-binding protein